MLMCLTGDKFSCFMNWSTADLESPRVMYSFCCQKPYWGGRKVMRFHHLVLTWPPSGLPRIWAISRGSSTGSDRSVRQGWLFLLPTPHPSSFFPSSNIPRTPVTLQVLWDRHEHTHTKSLSSRAYIHRRWDAQTDTLLGICLESS